MVYPPGQSHGHLKRVHRVQVAYAWEKAGECSQIYCWHFYWAFILVRLLIIVRVVPS